MMSTDTSYTSYYGLDPLPIEGDDEEEEADEDKSETGETSRL